MAASNLNTESICRFLRTGGTRCPCHLLVIARYSRYELIWGHSSCHNKWRTQLAPSSLAIIGLCLISVQLPALADEARLTDQIRETISKTIDREGIPGLSLAVAKDNRIIYSRAFGLADVENDVSVTTETRFRTASIAKSMTATLILKLSEDGLLDLDEGVQKYVPQYPDKKWKVTSRQVLGHLGGIRHYKSKSEASSTEYFNSLKAALRTFADDPLLHEPGTKFRYSSFGYNLLGSVAEGAGKKDFMTLLNKHVLTPAGMTQTESDDHFRIIKRRARGYIRLAQPVHQILSDSNKVQGRLLNAALHDTSMKIPGGGLVSTPEDLVRFAIAVNTHKLLKDETVGMMWTAQQTDDGKSTGYGLGWGVGNSGSRKTVSHSGGQSGTSTMLHMLPDSGTCVVIMCNLQGVKLRAAAAEIAKLVSPE